MRAPSERDVVRDLVQQGQGDSAIARRTGIPRETVRDWRSRGCPSARVDPTCPRCACADTLAAVSAGRNVERIGAKGCVVVSCYWKHWPCLFPQHGPGPKHGRTIRLVEWQEDAVGRWPHKLLRGLIHSDGTRVMNRIGARAYPRYFFTNHSADIL